MFILLLYSFIAIPIILAFDESIELINVFMKIELGIEIIYLIDILISFITPFYSFDESLIKNILIISNNYIKSWFIFDLISEFPICLFIITIYGNYNNTLLRLLKCIKIIKYSLSSSNTKEEEVAQSSPTLSYLAKFYFWFIIITHFVSCIYIYIAMNNEYNDDWIIRNDYIDSQNFSLYINSLYFHWSTIFTIGYGDILSVALKERVYNIFLMLIGIAVYSYTVTSLGNLLSKLDLVTIKYNKNINTLNELKGKHNISESFYKKLKNYFDYHYQHNTGERFKFVEELPRKIMKDLLLNMHREIITNLHYLSNSSNEEFITRVVLSMRPVRAIKKEKLFDVNEVVEEMYLIRKGILSLCLGDEWENIKIMEIRKNEHFGDIFYLASQRTPYSLKVSSKNVDLLLIRKSDLIQISEEFPDSFEEIFNISKYNHLVMLEITENKKKKFIEEKNKIKMKENKALLIRENADIIKDLKSKDNIENLDSQKKSTIENPNVFTFFNNSPDKQVLDNSSIQDNIDINKEKSKELMRTIIDNNQISSKNNFNLNLKDLLNNTQKHDSTEIITKGISKSSIIKSQKNTKPNFKLSPEKKVNLIPSNKQLNNLVFDNNINKDSSQDDSSLSSDYLNELRKQKSENQYSNNPDFDNIFNQINLEKLADITSMDSFALSQMNGLELVNMIKRNEPNNNIKIKSCLKDKETSKESKKQRESRASISPIDFLKNFNNMLNKSNKFVSQSNNIFDSQQLQNKNLSPIIIRKKGSINNIPFISPIRNNNSTCKSVKKLNFKPEVPFPININKPIYRHSYYPPTEKTKNYLNIIDENSSTNTIKSINKLDSEIKSNLPLNQNEIEEYSKDIVQRNNDLTVNQFGPFTKLLKSFYKLSKYSNKAAEYMIAISKKE